MRCGERRKYSRGWRRSSWGRRTRDAIDPKKMRSLRRSRRFTKDIGRSVVLSSNSWNQVCPSCYFVSFVVEGFLNLLRGFALQRALEGVIQGSLRFFVFLLRDAALLVFDFEFEEFVLQAFQQHGRGAACSGKIGRA